MKYFVFTIILLLTLVSCGNGSKKIWKQWCAQVVGKLSGNSNVHPDGSLSPNEKLYLILEYVEYNRTFRGRKFLMETDSEGKVKTLKQLYVNGDWYGDEDDLELEVREITVPEMLYSFAAYIKDKKVFEFHTFEEEDKNGEMEAKLKVEVFAENSYAETYRSDTCIRRKKGNFFTRITQWFD